MGTTDSDDTAGSGVRIESFNAGEIQVGTDEQRLSVSLVQVGSEEEIDIYVDVTNLTEANIGIDDLGVVAESRYTVGWLVSDAEISRGERTIIQVTVTFDDEIEVDDTGSVSIDLTGLETSNGEHNHSLTYSATISASNGGPDFATGKTTTAAVIDPEQIENVLRVDPSDLRIGETSQQITVGIERATDDIDFRLDLRSLTDIGVRVENAGVVVEESAGERRNDKGEVEIEVTEAAIADGILQLGITTTADTLFVDIRVTDLDTQEAEAKSRVMYPVYVGDRPSEPTESAPFSISGATA
jgi:hypothetical protein